MKMACPWPSFIEVRHIAHVLLEDLGFPDLDKRWAEEEGEVA